MENQKILLVTGKGGVGKSTVAAAAALRLAREGKRVLLVELGDKSYYKYVFEKPIEHEPTEVAANLWVSRWEGEDCLREYIAHLVKLEKIVNLFFENKVMKALVQAAPALKELAIIGKLTSGRRRVGPKLAFDCIVMDAYSTGHFKALVMAPKGMGEAIPMGPMGEQCRAIEAVLKDASATQVWIVGLPEELPVTESIELAEFLKQELKISPRILLNKVMQAPVNSTMCETLDMAASSEDFLSYLCSEVRESNKARQDLKDYRVTEMPHEFSNEPRELLNFLAEKVPSI